ncbi:hypothetical protein KKB40_04290, partial [Patescibacteria group bacterium]|nr:hypothetical protein [Patescibacteria group bacterium]
RESGFLRGNLRSSTFFTEFGRDTFMRFQLGYQKVLTHTYEKDTSFNTRVVGDIITRMDMYRKMYRGIINGMDSLERQKFLAGRTMRTMAQYLALGRLIGEKTNECFPVIICHPTQNIGLFNGRNKFLLPSDGTFPQPTIPVIKMKKEVY